MNRIMRIAGLSLAVMFGLALGALPPRITDTVSASYFGMDYRQASSPVVQNLGIKWIRGGDQINAGPSGVYNVAGWASVGAQVLGGLFYPNHLFRLPGVFSPPNDNDAYADECLGKIKANPKVKTWEQWNEPWINEWAWHGGTAEEYRVMIKTIWDNVKPTHPDVNLIGGGSVAFNRDVLYAKGATTAGYADGSVFHPYRPVSAWLCGMVATQVILDKTYSKTQGRGGLWQTESGTRSLDYSDGLNWQAKYVGSQYVLQILGAWIVDPSLPIHIFNFCYGCGLEDYDIKGRVAETAYSKMTQILEGTRCAGDAFENSRGIWGVLFNPTTSTDTRARAVLLADGKWTESALRSCSNDYSGTISLSGSGIEAYDYMGVALNISNIPLTPWSPVYILAPGTTADLKATLNQALVRIATEVKVNPLSLSNKPAANMTIDIQIENMVNNARSGSVTLTPPTGWTLSSSSISFTGLAPGQVQTLRFPVSSATNNVNNKYTVGWSLAITGKSGTKTGTQEVQAAFAPKKTITVDGSFSDWADVPATTIGSNKFWTAWDNNNFYIAVQTAGMGTGFPVWNTTKNSPDYMCYATGNGIYVMLGCAENNPDDLLKGKPLYNKAGRCWKDYEFFLNPDATTPEVFRYAAPGTNYQNYYPTTAATTPAIGGMTSSEVTYKYSTGGNFEAAFKWSAIPDLKLIVDGLTTANAAAKINLAWLVRGATGAGQWQDVAGMAEDGIYGWSPSWSVNEKCNTPWTIINGDGSAPAATALTPFQQEKALAIPASMNVLSVTGSNVRLIYSVPEAQNVMISVFAMDGRKVATILNEQKPMGSYMLSWNAPASSVYLIEYRCGTSKIASGIAVISHD